jgi:GTP-binding protein HflX
MADNLSIDNKKIIEEKIYIIQPIFSDNYRVLHDEAVDLIASAGAVYCGTCYQTIKEINPATFIGSGKLAEIHNTLEGLEDITILFNGELSPSQTLNISAALDNRKVIDRTTLILDIFARNAVSSEGKIQVELAQLKYIYPRLKGKGAALSRLGGGIGSRGPGETQLETDRRHIRYRIKFLESRIEETQNRRNLQSERRIKDSSMTIALVGYTNTGKSTLLNLLTGADVLAKDALFATLDPTARKFVIDGKEFILIDTVGFIQELPHDIVEAFKSTLDSALKCSLALFVADASGDYEMQFKTTIETLQSLGFDRKYIKVLNKCDKLESNLGLPSDCICISAKTNEGIDELKQAIIESLKDSFVTLDLQIEYKDFGKYATLAQFISETSRTYNDSGMEIIGTVNCRHAEKFTQFKK